MSSSYQPSFETKYKTHSHTDVHFERPKVPVVFVLGGPGSGREVHSDHLVAECKQGLVHINMMTLLEQCAIGNGRHWDMTDVSYVTSRVLVQTLMLEMKMEPTARAFVVSGFPRTMDDTMEYTEKIQVLSGVVLISWRQSVLQKQWNDSGTATYTELQLAQQEFDLFYRDTLAVCDHYEQLYKLVSVNGEQDSADVYRIFRRTVLDMIGAHGVQIEAPPDDAAVEPAERPSTAASFMSQTPVPTPVPEMSAAERRERLRHLPPVICVIGGPGCAKEALFPRGLAALPDSWGIFSIGHLAREILESGVGDNLADELAMKQALNDGQLIPKAIVDRLIESQMLQLARLKGVIILGLPHDQTQLSDFELAYDQRPPIVLVNSLKLQLARDRPGDKVSAFAHRLDHFQRHTAPMLDRAQRDKRLHVVDGNTDSASVQQKFEKILEKLAKELEEEDIKKLQNVGKLYIRDTPSTSNAQA